MILSKISLTNFKNYENVELDFCPGLNCITGLNGSGKTNILDAIYYLSLTKSAFNSTDSQNIRHQEKFFSIRAQIEISDKKNDLQCSLKLGEKKIFKVDGSSYEKLSEHIGKFPIVLIAPNDDDLIRDSSEVRRKFFDSIISQVNKNYLEKLIRYNHFLKQRNSFLKRMNETGVKDMDLLKQYDDQLIDLSIVMSKIRDEFTTELLPEFLSHYEKISDGKEIVKIQYSTKVNNQDFEENYRASLQKDIMLQRTTMGIHRDDYLFLIGDHSLKKIGSQGHQKSFLISLKLSQFEYIKKKKKVTPILLLDDIFDKLDDERIKMLLQMITDQKFKQIFLTDAREERTEKIIKTLDAQTKIFNIKHNKVFQN